MIIIICTLDNGSLPGEETRSASPYGRNHPQHMVWPVWPHTQATFKYTIVKIYLRYLSQCNHDGISEKRTRNPLNNIINTNTREVRILASAKILVLNKKHCLYW